MIFLSRTKRIDRHVIDLVEQKRWEDARYLLRQHPEALRDHRSFLKDKIEREAVFSGSEIGRRLGDRDFVGERIAGSFDPAAWEIADIADIPGGLIGSRNLRITLSRRSDGSTLDLFEKIYSSHDRLKAAMEIALFEDLDADALLAPRLHGSYRHDAFTSLLFAHIDGDPVDNADRLRTEAVRTLWNAPPSPRLLKRYGKRILPSIERIVTGSQFSGLAAESGQASHPLLDTRRMLDEELPRLLADVPMCVMHGDMRAENFLIDRSDGRTYLIDWEKWGVSPVGFGLRLRVEEYASFLDQYRKGPDEAHGIADFPAFGFMVAFGSFLHHLERNRSREYAAWLPVLQREYEALT